MSEQQNLPHTLSLDERKSLSVTGVTEVVSFDESAAVLNTSLGTLIIQGDHLKLKTLSLDGGQVAVSGSISSMVYEQPRAGGLRKLFG